MTSDEVSREEEFLGSSQQKTQKETNKDEEDETKMRNQVETQRARIYDFGRGEPRGGNFGVFAPEDPKGNQ